MLSVRAKKSESIILYKSVYVTVVYIIQAKGRF
jgi:hypothetical protein